MLLVVALVALAVLGFCIFGVCWLFRNRLITIRWKDGGIDIGRKVK